MVNDQPSPRHGVLRHLGRLVRAERPGVDEGEVRHVEEVVRQQSRRGPHGQGGQLPGLERRIVGFGDGAERRQRGLGGEEHHAVGHDQSGRRREPGRRRQGRARTERRNLDAGARRVEPPTVVGALEHPRLAVPDRKRGAAMRAAIGERHDPPVGSIQHPRLSQEQESPWLLGHLGRPRHRMPAVPERRVGIGEGAAHWPPPSPVPLTAVKQAPGAAPEVGPKLHWSCAGTCKSQKLDV